MKCPRQAIQSFSGLILVGAVLIQVTLLPAQNIPIAVVEFEGNGISQTEAIALTDRLRNELFRLGAFEVVERGMMETILTEQDFQLTGCTSNECLVEVGQLLGARQVVGGRISRVGAMFTVSARVVDVQTGKLLGVSDFDLRGGLEEILTDGMKQVAVMLSMSEADVESPSVVTIEDSPPQSQAVEPQPATTMELPATKETTATRTRFQVGYGFPLGYHAGYVLWGSWSPIREIPLGKTTFLLALTGGLYNVHYDVWSCSMFYILLSSNWRYQGEQVGLGGKTGLGYGTGEEHGQEYPGYYMEDKSYSVGSPIFTLGGELAYPLWKIQLMMSIDYFISENLMYGVSNTFIFAIGIKI